MKVSKSIFLFLFIIIFAAGCTGTGSSNNESKSSGKAYNEGRDKNSNKENSSEDSSKDAANPPTNLWQSYRNGYDFVGATKLVGHMKTAPREFINVITDGAPINFLEYDINKDGINELLDAYGNIYDYKTGNIKSQLNNINLSITGFYDFDGDGNPEILSASGNTLRILSLEGEILWEHAFLSDTTSLNCNPNNIAVGNIRGGKGLELVINLYNDYSLYCFTFDEGIKNGRLLWRWVDERDYFQYGVGGSPPNILVGELKKGRKAVAWSHYSHIEWLDPETGKPIAGIGDIYSGPDKNGRMYGLFANVDVNGDGIKDGVMVADAVTKHVCTVINDAAGNSHLAFDKYYGYMPSNDQFLKVNNDSVCDIDGDGRIEIVYSVWDKTKDPVTWTTYVVDATNGDEKAIFPGMCYEGTAKLDNSGTRQILMSKSDMPTVPKYAAKYIYALENGAWKEAFTSENVSFCKTTLSPNERNPDIRDNSKAYNSVTISVDINGDGIDEFLIYDKNEKTTKVLQLFRKDPVLTIKEGEAVKITSLALNEKQILVCDNTYKYSIVDKSGKVLSTYFSQGGGDCPPAAGDIDGDGKVEVVISGDRFTKVYKYENKKLNLWWEKENTYGARSLGGTYFSGYSATIADFTGKGELEVIAGSHSDEGYPMLLAFSPDGKEERFRYVFEGYGENTLLHWTICDFNNDGKKDIVATLVEELNSASAHTLFIDGKTLELWQNKNFRLDGGNERTFGAWMGFVAAKDTDGDGADELYAGITDYHMRLDCQKSNPLYFGLVVTMSFLKGKGYYDTPIIADFDGDGADEVFFCAGHASFRYYDHQLTDEKLIFDAEPVWQLEFAEFDQNTRFPGIGDYDGDGKLEIAVSYGNGKLVCYNCMDGSVKWEYDTGGWAGNILSADVNGDGRTELVFWNSNGSVLSAIRVNDQGIPELIWKVKAWNIRDVIAIDIDNDGSLELAASGNGRLVVYK